MIFNYYFYILLSNLLYLTDINVWQCTPQNDALWLKSKLLFEKKLKPAEEIIAQKLHIRFNNLPANQVKYYSLTIK